MSAASSEVAEPARAGDGWGPVAEILRPMWRKYRWAALLLIVAEAIGLGLLIAFGSGEAIRKVAPMLLAFGLVFVWWCLFYGLMVQNHPNLARLVPGQLRRLREIGVGGFVLLTLLAGALLWISTDRFMIGLMIGAAAFVTMALTTRWPMLWLVVSFVPSSYGVWGRSAAFGPLRETLLAWHDSQPLTQAATVVGLGAWVVWKLLMGGGASHMRQWRRAQVTRAALKSQMMGASGVSIANESLIASLFRRLFCWLRNAWRERLVRNARPTPNSVLARVELAANPQTHWTSVIGAAMVVLSVVLIAVALGVLWSGSDVTRALRAASSGVAFGIMSMLINPTMAAITSLHKRRREQALLMLLPGVPRGAELNRRLALRQWLQFLGCWAFGLALILLLQGVVGRSLSDGGDKVYAWGLNYASIALPCSLLGWRDWSRQGEPSGVRMALLICALIAGMIVLGVLVDRYDVSPWLVMACSVVITLALAVWRWPTVLRSPQFWPVGRWS